MGDPICKWRIVNTKNIRDVVSWLPKRPCSEAAYRAHMSQCPIGGTAFLKTACQFSCQLGLQYVDENGILNINVGEVSGEILLLNDHTVTGSTSGETSGSTSGETSEESTAVITPDGEMSISGQTSVQNNILLLNAKVTPNGILEITT
jgi:hypothetical protein